MNVKKNLMINRFGKRMAILLAFVLPIVSPIAKSSLVTDAALQEELTARSSASILPEVRWTFETVHSGDSLSRIFKRIDLNMDFAKEMTKFPKAKKYLKVIHPNDELRVARNSRGDLLGMEYYRRSKLVLMYLYLDDEMMLLESSVAEEAGSLSAILKQTHPSIQPKNKQDPLPEIDETQLIWKSSDVTPGDSLTGIFQRLGLPAIDAFRVANTPKQKWFRNLKVGDELRIGTYRDGSFAKVELQTGPLEISSVFRVDEQYYFSQKTLQPEYQTHSACGTVKYNLFTSGYETGIPEPVLFAFVDLFSSRIDFVRQARKNDEFCVVYKQGYIDGASVGDPLIIVARYQNAKGVLDAHRHVDNYGRVIYYDQHGENMRGHFLRAPLEFARITSVFSNSRFHPIYKKWMPHRGVDYGAKTGTPIRSTATGIVAFMGWKGGFGKTIVIRHGSKYETYYAHLSRFAKKFHVGKVVEQGQTIGYVGSTGVSTGPHLHYEFRVNGKHRDPVNYPLPNGKPIPEQYKEQFEQQVADNSKMLDLIEQPKLAYTPPEVKEKLKSAE